MPMEFRFTKKYLHSYQICSRCHSADAQAEHDNSEVLQWLAATLLVTSADSRARSQQPTGRSQSRVQRLDTATQWSRRRGTLLLPRIVRKRSRTSSHCRHGTISVHKPNQAIVHRPRPFFVPFLASTFLLVRMDIYRTAVVEAFVRLSAVERTESTIIRISFLFSLWRHLS